MSEEPQAPEVGDLSFDDALEQLESAARQLEDGEVPLEESLRVYERAVALFRHCSRRLHDVEQRLELLTKDLDGELATSPLDAEAESAADD